MTETMKDETRLKIKNLYAAGNSNEVALRTMNLYIMALRVGKNLGEITINIIDLGVKPTEQAAGLLMMIDDWPTEDLSDVDKEVQKFCRVMNKEIVNQ